MSSGNVSNYSPTKLHLCRLWRRSPVSWLGHCCVPTGKSADFVDYQLCICKTESVVTHLRATQGLSEITELTTTRHVVQPRVRPASTKCTLASQRYQSPVHLTKTYWGPAVCQANASQHTPLTRELRGKPHTCKKAELVLKGLNGKACGPQERLFLFVCFLLS